MSETTREYLKRINDELATLRSTADRLERGISSRENAAALMRDVARRLVVLLASPEPSEPDEDDEDGVYAASESTEHALRRLLWHRHGCPITALYGDDGEMSCGRCRLDFLRMAPEDIEARWYREALAAAAQPSEPEAVRAPTDAEIDDACMWYRHDFGLLQGEKRNRIRFEALEWLRAWCKVRDYKMPPEPGGHPSDIASYMADRLIENAEQPGGPLAREPEASEPEPTESRSAPANVLAAIRRFPSWTWSEGEPDAGEGVREAPDVLAVWRGATALRAAIRALEVRTPKCDDLIRGMRAAHNDLVNCAVRMQGGSERHDD